MPRSPSSRPNDVELAILRVVWNRKSCTVREVHEALQAERDTGYTSTLKMMQVMCEKGLLKRDDSQRPQVYRPAIPQQQTQKKL
ncbi:MAG TPA: BlaI/MecI/CopY family transcriptional regulator, partial [Planctomycetaceae bacterium]|nr:BlaI/MecI/CopY family transcriptional regulator [Planctomycetaceae bacterium]